MTTKTVMVLPFLSIKLHWKDLKIKKNALFARANLRKKLAALLHPMIYGKSGNAEYFFFINKTNSANFNDVVPTEWNHTSHNTWNTHFSSRVYLSEAEWPPKSHDLMPLDFSLWGYLRKRVPKQKKEHQRTIAEIEAPLESCNC